MRSTDEQVRRLRRERAAGLTIECAAMKAGMHRNTASRHLKREVPSQTRIFPIRVTPPPLRGLGGHQVCQTREAARGWASRGRPGGGRSRVSARTFGSGTELPPQPQAGHEIDRLGSDSVLITPRVTAMGWRGCATTFSASVPLTQPSGQMGRRHHEADRVCPTEASIC